jgi:hypothetical protein
MHYKVIAINAYLSKALRLEETCVTKQDKLFVVGIRFIYSRKIVLNLRIQGTMCSRSSSLDCCTRGLGFKASTELWLE